MLKKLCKKIKYKRYILLACIIIFLLSITTKLETVTYTVKSKKINNTIKIALVTDLHGCYYGENQEELISAIDKENPDIILLGGDIFDDKVPYENSEIFLKKIAHKYPLYYVNGNHEYWSNDIENIYAIINKYDVTILDGDYDKIEINGQWINIFGITDPDIVKYTNSEYNIYNQLNTLEEVNRDNNFSILLAHRPEFINTYLNYDYDLITSGHAHGGQWRLPYLINGLFAPNQGLFPKYAGGGYDFDSVTFIVSRGLARESTKIPRIFNNPELVIINLESE